MKEKLCHNNFIMYAMKMYSNPNCTGIEEFKEDLLRVKYIKRLLLKYKKKHDLKDRLILNHIIIIYNLFGNEASTRMLFFKLKDYHPLLKPFLIFLNVLPERVVNIGIEGKTINTSDIPLDSNIITSLRKIWPG